MSSATHHNQLNLRHFALATIVPVIIMIAAMWIKPLWRDEIYSLYYADPRQSLSYLLEHRWGPDSHPPIHNVFLYYWTHIFSYPFGQKCLSLVFLVFGGMALHRLTPADRKRVFYVFALVSLGSYWVIYFATEIRPYVMNYVLCAITVFLVPHILRDGPVSRYGFYFLLTGAVLSLVHFFGGLWFASLGLVLGLSFLRRSEPGRFLQIGALSVIGLVPLLFWLAYSLPQIDIASTASDLPSAQKFTSAAEQFLRGLIVKTFGSNPLVTILGFGGIIAALRGRSERGGVLIFAAILTVILAFILHLTIIDMIKERAFIVIMPALLYLLSEHVSGRASKWTRFVPLAAMIMPFLFLGEYTKNKEQISGLQEAIAAHGPACEQAEILAFYRPSKFKELYPFATEMILNFETDSFQSAPRITNVMSAKTAPTGDCPIVAIGVLLPKTDEALLGMAEIELIRLGYEPEQLERKLFGKGRNVLWVETNDVP